MNQVLSVIGYNNNLVINTTGINQLAVSIEETLTVVGDTQVTSLTALVPQIITVVDTTSHILHVVDQAPQRLYENTTVGGYAVALSGISNSDVLQFLDGVWKNTKQVSLVDGGNF